MANGVVVSRLHQEEIGLRRESYLRGFARLGDLGEAFQITALLCNELHWTVASQGERYTKAVPAV